MCIDVCVSSCHCTRFDVLPAIEGIFTNKVHRKWTPSEHDSPPTETHLGSRVYVWVCVAQTIAAVCCLVVVVVELW